MKKIVILSAGPGLKEIVDLYGHSSNWIPEILSNPNIEYIVKKVYEMDPCSLNDGDAWIITGSKYSVYEDAPWIKSLLEFTERLIKNKKPILGICFGHQVLAKALGANVIKNPLGWELGSYKLSLTDSGLSNALFDGVKDRDVVYESHQDIIVDLPDSLEILANTEKSVQSFEYKDYVYGVQFHPEFSWDVTRMLMDLRIKRGIKVDNNHLDKSENSYKILHNFVKMI